MWKIVSTATALAALSGCATIPAAMQAEPVAEWQIIQAVKCELASIYRQADAPATPLIYSSALTKLDLATTDDGEANSGAAFEHKWDGGSIELKPDGTLGQKSERTKKGEFLTAFGSLDPNTTTGRGLAGKCAPPGAHGELGLAEWLHQVLLSSEDGASTFQTLAFIAEFTVTRGVGGGLEFKSSAGNISIDKSQLSRERKNRIEVTIEVEPPPAFGTPKVKAPGSKALVERLQKLQEPEDKGTTITVDPGQTIVVQ